MTGVSTWGPSQPSLLTMHHWPASLPFSAAYIEPQCCSNILMWPAARKYQKPSPTHAKILAAVLICLAWAHELGAGVNIVRGLPLSGAHKPGCTRSSPRGCVASSSRITSRSSRLSWMYARCPTQPSATQRIAPNPSDRGYTFTSPFRKITNEARDIQTPNLLIWSQTRCRCAIAP